MSLRPIHFPKLCAVLNISIILLKIDKIHKIDRKLPIDDFVIYFLLVTLCKIGFQKMTSPFIIKTVKNDNQNPGDAKYLLYSLKRCLNVFIFF